MVLRVFDSSFTKKKNRNDGVFVLYPVVGVELPGISGWRFVVLRVSVGGSRR